MRPDTTYPIHIQAKNTLHEVYGNSLDDKWKQIPLYAVFGDSRNKNGNGYRSMQSSATLWNN